ncbi:MAG: type II toxin-antitoxin system ParD family antitoxin [Blastocatellia bacterium]
MNVTLSPELQQIVNQRLATGLYNSVSEVIREALQLLQEQDQLLEFRLEELRREINLGFAQIRNGEGILGEQVFEELKQMGEQYRRYGFQEKI